MPVEVVAVEKVLQYNIYKIIRSPFHLETGFFRPYFSLSFTIVEGVVIIISFFCFCFFGALAGKGGCGGNGGAGGIVFKLSSSGKGEDNIVGGSGGGGGGGGGATAFTSIVSGRGGGGGGAFLVIWAINCETNKLTTKVDMIFFI